MATGQSNFDFLKSHSPQLAKLGVLAERYFHDDPPGALGKLRIFGEFLAKEIAAQHALLPAGQSTFDDILRALKAKGVIPRDVADYLYHLKRSGNAALHENTGSGGEALHALKIARAVGVWYHKSYAGNPGFKAGPFVPPTPPIDATEQLQQEIAELRKAVQTSSDAEAKARLSAQQARDKSAEMAASMEEEAEQRAFWEQYAAEAEEALQAATRELAETQARAEKAPPQQLELLSRLGAEQAQEIEIDEATTRVLIDDQLRAVGWEVDSAVMRHAAGVRPAYGKAMAIAEWPTASGPVDYALFIDGRCVGVIEAKRQFKDVPDRIGQAKRYAKGIELTPDELPTGGPWTDGDDRFRVPFLFVTNGRSYVKQLATKSGTWFWDARAGVQPKALVDWFSPRDLSEKLEQELDEDLEKAAEREIGVTGLRPYQQDAINAVRDAIQRGQDHILLAMATGTGKTRLAIALMYELLRAKRFRRILFLVDRNALGRQTLDAMSTTDTNGFLKFDQVFPVADLARKFPEATDRVQVATVQAMIRRVFDDPDVERPTPGTYDLIIVDEAHRGYTLDAELREDDLGFRNLDDYLSAYRRVLDYFDATKVALTATPALHTREIFGPAVFRYGYRQAVIDGYLIDHRPPRRITTALSQTGIHFDQGEEVNIVDPRTGQVDLFDLEDQVDFEVGEFNKKVYTPAFNRAVADAIALECPPDQPGKTLIFAARDDHADTLVEQLTAALTEEYGPQPHDMVEKITGSVDKPLDRIKAFKNDPRPKYVVTVDLLTTGIDVPAITNLVFVRRVNSRILYDQMIGRATRRCDEIGKEYFRIFDAVDIYANLQEVTDMRPVVVDPGLTFSKLVADLENAPTDEDRAFVRDQIVVKLRQRQKLIQGERREVLESVLGPLAELPDRLKDAPPEEAIALFRQHPDLARVLDMPLQKGGRDSGIFISEHPDWLEGVEDDFGNKASPVDYIENFETYVRANMNAVPAMIAATQRPRELTRKELKELALLLDQQGFSEANLRRAYGSTRNADIAAHIIGFVRQAALGDPLVPYETRVENGVQAILPEQYRWGALKSAPETEVLQRYKQLLIDLGDGSKIADRSIVAIFQNAATVIRTPANLRKLIDTIDGLHWFSEERDAFGDAYEGLLQKMAEETKRGAGQYFTPRVLIAVMTQLMQPAPGEVIQDPAAGTGGFLISANQYMKERSDDYFELSPKQQAFQLQQALRGIENVPDTFRLLQMNLHLHSVDPSHLDLADTLSPSGQRDVFKQADLILTNPPFGPAGGPPTRDDLSITDRVSSYQLPFVEHIIRALKPGGRAAVIVPDNVLFDDGRGKALRQRLMNWCNLHTVLRLPIGIFYAQGVKTNVLFFTRSTDEAPTTDTTKAVWIYDMRTGAPAYGKTNPIREADFVAFMEAFGDDPLGEAERQDQGEEGRWRCFTREQLAELGDDLDITWLKDASADPEDGLNTPWEFAEAIEGHLSAALEEVRALMEELGEPEVAEAEV